MGAELVRATGRRLRPPAGALLVLAAWLPALAAVAIGTANGAGWAPVLRLVVTALVYAPVAAVVLGIRRFAVAAITAGLAVSSGLAALTAMLPVEHAPALAAAQTAASYATHLAELAAFGILIWLLTPLPGRRRGVALGVAAILLDTLIALARWTGEDPPAWAMLVPLLVALLGFLTGACLTVRAWLRERGTRRIVLIWFAAGALLMVLSYLHLVPGIGPAPPGGIVAELGTAAFILAQGLLPTAVLAAVFGGAGAVIDRRLATGAVWTQALAGAIGLYVLVHALAIRFGASEAMAGALGAALLALSFSLTLGLLRRLTELIFFGPGASARAVLSRLAQQVSAGGDRDGLDELAEALREVWHLRAVSLRPAAERSPAVEPASPAGPPQAGPAVLEVRLEAGGSRVGTIVCSADDPSVLRNVVQPMLEEIGGLLAAAVQLATANQDLAAMRQRTLGVSQEERRMLHRELHDEIAPALAGIGFGMAGARRMLAAKAPGAPAAIAELQTSLSRKAETVRRLARALLPAALDAGDLEGALRELAARFTAPGFAVSASAPGADALDGETQLAAYLVLADAVEILSRSTWTSALGIEVDTSGAGEVVAHLLTDAAPDSETSPTRTRLEQQCTEAGAALDAHFAAGRARVVIRA